VNTEEKRSSLKELGSKKKIRFLLTKYLQLTQLLRILWSIFFAWV